MLRTHFLLIFSMAAAFAFGSAESARAQDAPRVEIFGGYSYMRGNVVFSGTPFNLNGASGSVAYNLNSWFGLVGDFGIEHQGSVTGNQFSLTVSTYQFGPRLTWRKNKRLNPFAHILIGGGHAGGSLYTSSLGSGLAPLGASNDFNFTTGGGVDWKLTSNFGIRLLQAEYLHSQFLNRVNNSQSNFRLSAGIIFSLGKQ